MEGTPAPSSPPAEFPERPKSDRPSTLSEASGDLPGIAVASDDDQLAAGEQVGQRFGNEVECTGVAQIEVEIGQDRRADLGIEGRHRFVDVLIGQDVGRRPMVGFGQRVEQDGVDVIADPEGEQSQAARGRACQVFEDCLALRHPFGGQAIGQEQDQGRSFGVELGGRLPTRRG